MTDSHPRTTPIRVALVVSRFNPDVTSGLLRGAESHLGRAGVSLSADDVFDAPGVFEIPLIAQTLARTGRYDGVICLGCVIKGDTAHFEFISLAASTGLMQATLETGAPITFGILTTYTDAQAEVRSAGDSHNKGIEAAAACVESIETLRRIRSGAQAF